MISIIVAAAENNGIGKENKIPWRLPKDWRRFAALTKGHTVVMGRATHESILGYLKRPLPDRISIVITRNKDFKALGCLVVYSLAEAFSHAPNKEETFVIGGGKVYEAALPFADRIYKTTVHTTIEADTFFPELNELEWKVVSSEFVPKDEKNHFDTTFTIYERARNDALTNSR